MKHLLAAVLLLSVFFLEAGTIVTGKLKGRYDKIAVQELLEFLPRLTGEKWQAVPESKYKNGKGKVIYLGDTALARKKGFIRNKINPEGWHLRNISNGVIVTGGYPIGTLYGAYDLLKRCGVRFLTMDETIVPKHKNFRFPKLKVDRVPSYTGRLVYDLYPHLLIYVYKTDLKRIHQDYNRHRLRLGSAGTQLARHPAWYLGEYDKTTVGNTGHTYVYYANPRKYMKKHPEYYSMNERGQRYFGQLCLSNKEVWEVMYKELRAYIIRDRKESWHGVGQYRRKVETPPRSYKIFQMDGYNYLCLCKECKKITAVDGDAGLQMRALNYIARKIRKEFPDVEIVSGAYCSTDVVPKVTRPEKNLSVSWTNLYLSRDPYRPMEHPFNKSQLAKFNAWNKLMPMAIYDYWNMGGKFYYYPPRQEVVTDAVIADLRFYHKRGVRRFFTEYEKGDRMPQPFFDLHCYLAAELLMDINVDAEKVISEFIEGYYGAKAAPILKKYLQELREGVKTHPTRQFTMHVQNWHFATPEFLFKTYKNLERAEKLSGKKSKYGLRIRELMIPLLWEICSFNKLNMPIFVKNGISEAKIRQQALDYTAEYLRSFGGTEIDKLIKFSKEQLDLFFVNLNCDDKFPGYSANDIKVFGYPHCRPKPTITEIVDDPDSPVGKAICCYGTKNTIHSRKARSTDHSWLWLTTFAMHDGKIPRGTISYRVKRPPQDEKYHWYKMPQQLSCAKGNISFWGAYGYLHMDLSTLFRPADGRDDMNTYDIYFSAKFTGPGYVKGSKKRNAIWIDRVVAIWSGAKPKAVPAKKGK